MTTNRLEAFSDGVLAIIITIMVLELHLPEGATLHDLRPLLPVFLTYLFSFLYVGIYWNNHHHLMNITQKVDGRVLWANLHLLFWLSLMPFATGWMGNNHFEDTPTAVYGFILLMNAISWKILAVQIIRLEGQESRLSRAYQNDKKLIRSIVLYAAGIACSFFYPPLSVALYALVALLWFIPDRRIERMEA